jgi:hypothetical protein
MTPEEMEKTIQFILEQQAHFAAAIQKLTETQERFSDSQAKLMDATLGNTGMIGRILTALDRITEEHVKLAEAQAHTDLKVAELTVRLDAFIVTVERYISERRNGKGEG